MPLVKALEFEDRLIEIVADRLGKEELSKNPLRWVGSGVIGDDSTDEVSGDVVGVLRELLGKKQKSKSSVERKELFEEPLEVDRMSGAFRAWTLVVERSSVGKEIFERSMVPAGYLKETSVGVEEASCWRLARLVKALASDMVEEDIF